MAQKDNTQGGHGRGKRKPTADQIVRYGKIILSHTYGRSIWGESDSICVYKWRGLYAALTDYAILGPFDNLDEAAASSYVFDVGAASTEIDSSELSADELVARFHCEPLEDGFDLRLNGETWVYRYDGDGFRRTESRR
jgi:hypothetical protein